jgi:hypothetical protein
VDRPKLEVADIFRRYGRAWRDKHGSSMSTAERRVMTAIEVWRTVGSPLHQCPRCRQGRMVVIEILSKSSTTPARPVDSS